jgi:hypothetical protein
MTTFLARMTGSGAGRARPDDGAAAAVGPARPIGQWGFAGVAVASLGGPLALAALNAPSIAGGAASSAGLAMVAAAAAFGFPLAIWFGYARHVGSSGGLYSFTEAAAGRRAVIIAAVAPLAADPALTQGEIPGMTVAERFVGHGFAVTVGIGVAVSTAVYPSFIARRGGRVLPAVVLAAGASALAVYGLWTTIQTSSF